MKWGRFIIVLTMGLAGCLNDTEEKLFVFPFNYDFEESQHGWLGDFADYPVDDSVANELGFDYVDLPVNLGEGKKALMLTGDNPNGDLFMFVSRQLTGFTPNLEFNIVFNVQIASEAPTGSDGSDGYPGEGVYVKVGALNHEPKKVVSGDNFLMNIDKGNQGTSGSDMTTIGNIAVDEFTNSYTLINRTNAVSPTTLTVTSNSNGEVWLIIGFDSSFKGKTTVYITNVDVVFSVTGH